MNVPNWVIQSVGGVIVLAVTLGVTWGVATGRLNALEDASVKLTDFAELKANFKSLKQEVERNSAIVLAHVGSSGHNGVLNDMSVVKLEIERNKEEIVEAQSERKDARKVRNELNTRGLRIESKVDNIADDAKDAKQERREAKEERKQIRDALQIILNRLPRRARGGATDINPSTEN